ncbi:unnamed protein product [Caenorhabditis angaria]|uniref:Uncharacterized protein n=1 Tax=Caenorhabditis angaria TaxID=860376 RepID=A0A9P1IT80_9PELO|nr:unnamed protein product [Caenorhabditis angaria]
MPISEIKTGEQVAEFIKDPSPAVLHFYANWAPSCEQVNALIDDFVEDSNLAIRTAFIDAEGLPGITLNFKVTAAPTLIYFSNGKEVGRVDGFLPTEIKEKALNTVTRYSTAAPFADNVDEEALKKALFLRIEKLTKKSPVMLFMKGDPSQPKCGFSRTIVGLLQSKNIEFDSFDILSDDSVRQGLKEYSNWPTYPQLYLNGELVGGLDVVKEEFADEAFVEKLPKVGEGKLTLEDRLKKLISSQRMMLFMKGDRNEPKCGFSRTIVGLLNEAKADYGTFDILGDEEVRQGLKTFSNWPTYPQLYLDGELIGGLDVVKEELLDTHFLRSMPRVGRS